MDYLFVKWVHVLSSTILFGAGVGSALHMLLAIMRGQIGGIAGATRNVVIADWLLTTPTALLQPASGLWLVHQLKLPWSTPWIAWSLLLYVVAIACWIPVVWIQIRMRDLAVTADRGQQPLPPAFHRYLHWWSALGVAAFLAFLLIFWLMVAKSLPWSHG